MWVTIRDWLKRKDTRELLEYYRDINPDCANVHPGNIEDDFSNITGITEILSK